MGVQLRGSARALLPPLQLASCLAGEMLSSRLCRPRAVQNRVGASGNLCFGHSLHATVALSCSDLR
jgi:hypothetical protein